jgi:hypothetical protein
VYEDVQSRGGKGKRKDKQNKKKEAQAPVETKVEEKDPEAVRLSIQ